MNLDSLGASFDAHKVPILAAAGVGVAALALRKRKQTAAGAPAAGAAGATTTAAGYSMPFSAGGQGAAMTGAAPYDSTASDLYGAVQPQLEALSNQLTQLSANPPMPVPAPPIASTLTTPLGTGSYVHLSDGTIAEVEGDRSMFGMTPQQWLPLFQGGARETANLPSTPNYYSTVRNLTPPPPIPVATTPAKS